MKFCLLQEEQVKAAHLKYVIPFIPVCNGKTVVGSTSDILAPVFLLSTLWASFLLLLLQWQQELEDLPSVPAWPSW